MCSYRHVPVHLPLFTGPRKGEVLGVDWRDVDNGACTIQVRRALLNTAGNAYLYGEPRSRGSSRTVGAPPLTSLLGT